MYVHEAPDFLEVTKGLNYLVLHCKTSLFSSLRSYFNPILAGEQKQKRPTAKTFLNSKNSITFKNFSFGCIVYTPTFSKDLFNFYKNQFF